MMKQCECVYCSVAREKGMPEFYARWPDGTYIRYHQEASSDWVKDKNQATKFTKRHMIDDGGFGSHVTLEAIDA